MSEDDQLQPEEMTKIRNAVELIGSVKTAAILHISRLALANTLAGLETTKGTKSLIRTHLTELENEV